MLAGNVFSKKQNTNKTMKKEFAVQKSITNINWSSVKNVIEKAGLASKTIDLTQKAFQNSYAKVFIFDNSLMVGVGRAISDGVSESALYDIAVLPEYQKRGIGKLIIEELHNQLTGTNIILYSRPGVEDFYKLNNYSKMKTGMAMFIDKDSKREKGFIE